MVMNRADGEQQKAIMITAQASDYDRFLS